MLLSFNFSTSDKRTPRLSKLWLKPLQATVMKTKKAEESVDCQGKLLSFKQICQFRSGQT